MSKDLGDHGGMFDGGDDLQGANRGLKPFHRRATGSTANYSQRTVESDARVEVGASDKYEARCRKCFVPHSDKPTMA
jgi:hypothetical protein